MADEVVIDIQNALGREPKWWDPVDGMHFGEKWVGCSQNFPKTKNPLSK